MSISLQQADSRRRKRFTLSGRTTLSAVVGSAEGLVAGLLSLTLAYANQTHIVLVLAVTASLIYGALAAPRAQKFLAYPDFRQPFALHAVFSWIAAAGIGFLVALGSSRWDIDFGPVFWGWLLITPIVLTVLRVYIYRQIARMLMRGQLQVERFGIIGDSASVEHLRADPRVWQQGGQVVASFVLPDGLGGTLPPARLIADFARSCVEKNCQNMLVIGDLDDLDGIGQLLAPCRPFALDFLLYPKASLEGRKINLVDIVPLGSVSSLRLLSAPMNDSGRFFKRAFDILASSCGLLLLSPILIAVAIAIRATSPGPALFRQERRGFNGRNFSIYKFRSMRVMESGHAMTQAQKNDPRVTRIGAFIRRTSIDELPQLINVLKGEMSLVGPRPHAISHDDELSGKFELYAQRQRIKPGITGWAQVNGFRGDTSTQDKIEARTLHDLYYAENWSLLLDIWIVILTVFSPRTRQNAH
ncbi:exopolysaccharide biosynthesis polyprenyl glycosylphosphotransferase [Devosia soli]|uniref:exopolysaccharide biosynthesis polyprenyl glycosylphosphotransferase n=1 Tax=Devosia soli TaxID=361041 RepID=UPI00069AD56B|nr:exopolysaccharide biosynthesis polyprenyl glycosylphosphotransferase [Devosia soli]